MQFLDYQLQPPAFVPVTAWLRHGPFALWLVRAMGPRSIVELGTHHGYSYFCFCQAIAASDLSTKCYAIDTWQGDEHAGLYDGSVFDAVRAENMKYLKFSTLLRKTFAEALDDIEDGSVDLLHVDGRHFYDDVKEDFESWIPKLSDRAVVLFHDTEVREKDFGVYRYWSEISAEKPSLNFPYQHGLGVLFWGPDVAEGLKPLVSCLKQTDSQQQVITHFAELGERVAASSFNLERKNARLAKAATTIALLQSQLLAARRNPLKQMKRRLVFRITQQLAKASPPFSRRRADRFLRSAAKRDPNRNDLIKNVTRLPKVETSVRSTSPKNFNRAWYLETYPDVADSFIDPLEHYMTLGKAEGRRANALDLSTDVTDTRLDVLKAPAVSDEIVLFVTYAPAGQIKPHVPLYLDALKLAGLSTVLIIAADGPDEVRTNNLIDKVDGLFVRQNGGFDFAAWAHVAREIDFGNARLVCLANDSLVGPLTVDDLRGLMTRIRESDARLIGLTNGLDIQEHLQSFFLVAKDEGIKVLLDFLADVRSLQDKWQVIFSYEIQLLDFFRSKGIQTECLFPSDEKTNRTVHQWRELLHEGFPFIKMEVLQNPKATGWKSILRTKGYDAEAAQASVDLIESSLAGSTKDAELPDANPER